MLIGRDEQGFTLVELVVVMAILAILAALAVPRFSNVMVDAKFKAHNANVELLTRAVEMYNAQESAEFNAGMSELKAKGYIKQIPELSIKDLGAGNRVEDAIDDKEYTFNTESKNIDPGPYKLNRGNKWEKVNSGQ